MTVEIRLSNETAKKILHSVGGLWTPIVQEAQILNLKRLSQNQNFPEVFRRVTSHMSEYTQIGLKIITNETLKPYEEKKKERDYEFINKFLPTLPKELRNKIFDALGFGRDKTKIASTILEIQRE